MNVMKLFRYLLLLTVPLAVGCSSSFYSYGGRDPYADDLYATQNRAEIARRQQAEAEAREAEAAARRAQYEALLAEAEARSAQEEYNNLSYQSVLADSYESAYARRLRGFNSLSYRMPSSYYELRYSPAYSYVTAYDPFNYNIVVMGDQVWVEPKYISSMFGTWGAPYYSVGWYGPGFYDPWSFPYSYSYAWWGYPHYSWWDWYWYGPIWYPIPPHYHPWPGHHPGYHPGHHPDNGHNPSYYPNYRPWRGGNADYRGKGGEVRRSSPYTPPSGSGGNYRGSSGNYRGSGSSTTKPTNTGNYRGSGSSTRRPSDQGYSPTQRTERSSGSGTPYRPSSGGSNYRSGGNTGGGGSYRGSSGGGSVRGGGGYRR